MGEVKMRRRIIAIAILSGCLMPLASAGSGRADFESVDSSPHDGAALFSRTASQRLARDFSAPNISYLLYDARDDRFIAARWSESERPVPVGSLVKPFTALAYAESHDFRFPEHICAGGNSCWLPKGHGALGIVGAISISCNSYFTELGSQTGGAQVTLVARRFGLNGPGANASPEAMAGGFGVWRESPQSVVRAYAMLLGRRSQPAIRDIVNGMAESARTGTALALSRQGLHEAYLAKTGTALCTHAEHAPGDGFVIVAWPADLPRYLLLVRQHGVPGAQASALAGRMLRSLEP
jgi:cell division protein FtsI/penicillin-binding protein 2